MSKTVLIIIGVVIFLIIVYTIYANMQAKRNTAMQNYNNYYPNQSQKISASDLGSFVGGLIGGYKLKSDQEAAKPTSGTTTSTTTA